MNWREWCLPLAWTISVAGTLLSLFYSAILLHDPCNLCWAQRIALFPLSVQLGIASYRNDKEFTLYAYPLCFFGFAAALYQSFLPLLPAHKSCGAGADCSSDLLLVFGMPFPWLSAAGFVLIALLLNYTRVSANR